MKKLTLLISLITFCGLNEAIGQQWANNGTHIYNTNSGNVGIGIGTSFTPAYKLHINNESNTASIMCESSYTGTANYPLGYIRLKNTATGDMFNMVLRKNGTVHEMLQSSYDASASLWREFIYYNYGTRKYEMRAGVVDAEFKNTGNLLFNNTGNVGIGTGNPSNLLHIVGGDVKIGNTSGDARKLYFGDGTAVYVGEETTDNRLGLSATSMTFNINGSTGADGQVLTSNGTTCLWEDLPVSALSGTGTTNYLARWLSSNTLGTGLIRDDNSTVGINAAPDALFRLKVEGGGGKTAVYGRYDDFHIGYLGSLNYGAYGGYNADRYGYLGNINYGVYGSYDMNHYGSIGSAQYGVYGYNSGNTTGNAGVYGSSEAGSAGTPGVFGYNNASDAYGYNYTIDNSCNGVVGWAHYGSDYHFGVFGSRSDDAGGPSAGVIGSVSYSNAGKPWGALGFQDAYSNEFAGYFNGNILLTAGINDGSGYGISGSSLLSNGAGDVYWSAGASLSGSGTANYIPKWTGSATLSNSLIYDDGTNVGIGTASPTAKLFVDANTSSISVYGQYGGSVYGYLGGPGTGAYGQYNSARYGFIGNSSYGVYGQYSSTIHGYLGGSNYGSYGQYNTSILGFQGSVGFGSYGQYNSLIKGYLGSSNYGAYGQWNDNQYGYLGSTLYGAFGQYNPSIAGYLGSANYGAYGQNSTRSGFLGSTTYGAFGQYDANKYGYLGSTNYGAYGQYDANRFGYIGSSSYGAYGQHSASLLGYLGGVNYGAYGQYDANHYGYFGSINYGAYGQYSSSILGYMGSSNYGVYGQNSTAIYGALGTSLYGVFGQRTTVGSAAGCFEHNGSPASFTKQYAIEAYNLNSIANDGNGYGYASNNSGGIRSCNDWGSIYSFGVAGWNYNDDYNRCGGVLGSQKNALYWGALGYVDSGGNTYGGYFSNAHGQGGGKMFSGSEASGIGVGAWGDLMGADVHGGVYGMFVEGDNYSLYAKGPVYTNQPVIQLQESKDAERTALFSSTSTEVTVMISGQGQLVNGQCKIQFDDNFIKVVSRQSPLIITVTPMGPTNGVYVTNSGFNGFSVTENHNGSSNTIISYIVVGKRAGYESPELAKEVIASDFETNIVRGLHNDGDISTNGQGLYYQNERLMQGTAPNPVTRDKR